MFDHRRYILPMLPFSFSEKEKLGEPKEEIRNITMDLNICVLVISKYNICNLNKCILQYISFEYHLYPYKLFPWARHSSPPWQDLLCRRWTNRNWTQKDSTYNSLECKVKKKGSEVKSENLNTTHAKSCLHRGMWNGSTIQQNSAYVDVLSNPFTQ